MVSPANLFRMITELTFVLLGAFLAWAGLTGGYLFDPRKPAWLALGAALVYWGARTWIKTMRVARAADRTLMRIGGASLSLVGFIMLGLVFAELRWVGPVLAVAGGILAFRGLAGAVLALRAD